MRGTHTANRRAALAPRTARSAVPTYSFSAASRFIAAESFATFWRMIFPDLNFTVARAGMTKLLPAGWDCDPRAAW